MYDASSPTVPPVEPKGTAMRPAATVRTTVERADTPPSIGGLQAALEVGEGPPELFARSPELLDLVEATSGLGVGQLRALHAIGDAATTSERIARLTGEPPAATNAALGSLHDLGLVKLHDDGDVALTEAGRARRDQLVALSLRLTAYVADEAHQPTVDAATTVIHRLRTPTRTAAFPSHRPVA